MKTSVTDVTEVKGGISMKAHIPPASRMTNKQLEAVREHNGQESIRMSRRFYKITALVLNEVFGFGTDRLLKFTGRFEEICTLYEDDPVYWEHVDQRCDQLGLGLPHEDYEEMERRRQRR